MPETAGTVDPRSADALRDAMTDKLIADGWITSPDLEAAFRAVPRHEFVPPGTPLEEAYGGSIVRTKKAADGTTLSSVSGAWLQARMIAQAGVHLGMKVLEIGSGGYNAALLAEVTGKEGRVVTIDIDPEITGRAEAALAAAGYGDRVEVVTGDGEFGVPAGAPYDVIIVTAGAWDIPRAWTGQLARHGTLVVPLRLNTLSRSLGFRCMDGHLASESWEMCGFVPMQGIGGRPEPALSLPGPAGGHVWLRFDQGMPPDLGVLDSALATEQVTAWSGIRIGHQVSFDGLSLWLAAFLPGFCRVAVSEGIALHAEGVNRAWFPGGVLGDSFSCLAMRKTGVPGAEFEFGVRAFGPHAAAAAAALSAQIAAWDARGRAIPQDAFAYWPVGTEIPSLGDLVSVFRKRHGTVTVTWPPAA